MTTASASGIDRLQSGDGLVTAVKNIGGHNPTRTKPCGNLCPLQKGSSAKKGEAAAPPFDATGVSDQNLKLARAPHNRGGA